MQNIFTDIKCREIILYNVNENWYIILYDLFSRLCYIATCGPFCKDATHMCSILTKGSTCRKNKKMRFFLILMEQVMTNMLKKISVLAQIFTKLWSIY